MELEPAVIEDLIGPNPVTPVHDEAPVERPAEPEFYFNDHLLAPLGHPPTPEIQQSAAPAVEANDDMDTSNDRLMDGGSPFDLDMDGDDTMVSALILAGANMNQAKTYAAAARGNTDVPTFMEFDGRGEIIKEANRAKYV